MSGIYNKLFGNQTYNTYRGTPNISKKKNNNLKNTRFKNDRTYLHIASRYNKEKNLELLLGKNVININKQNSKSMTALMLAAKYGYIKIVKLLLNNGADPFIINKLDESSALTIAYDNNYFDIVFELLKVKDSYGNTPLMRAAKDKSLGLFHKIVKMFSNTKLLPYKQKYFNELNKQKRNALMIFLSDRNSYKPTFSSIFKFTLKYIDIIDINAQDEYGNTALMYAVENDDEIIVENLTAVYEGKINFNLKNKDGYTAIMLAFKNRFFNILLYLKSEGASFPNKNTNNKMFLEEINVKDKFGCTLLIAAIKQHMLKFAIYLITEGKANIDLTDNFGMTALHHVSENDELDVVKLLCDKGADVDAVDKVGRTALILAINRDFLDIADYLITQGNANMNLTDNYGNTALHYASEKRDTNALVLLCDKGANIDAKDKKGQTPLMLAFKNVEMKIVRILLEKGANINAVDKEDRTVLMLETIRSDKYSVEFLLKNGANINAVDKEGRTALMLATIKSDRQIVRLLLEKGANINAVNKEGKTALMLAKNDTIYGLLHKNGKTPLQLSLEQNRKELAEKHLLKIMNEVLNIENNEERLSRMVKIIKTYNDYKIPIDDIYIKDIPLLHYVAHKGYKNILELLLSKGASINKVDKYGKTALNIARENNKNNIVELLEKNSKKFEPSAPLYNNLIRNQNINKNSNNTTK